MLAKRLAEIALEPAARDRLWARTRGYIRDGYGCSRVDRGDASILFHVPPEATALGFVRYAFDRPSTAVAEALRREADVLVGAGSQFGVEHHLRITHGLEPAFLEAALERAGGVLRRLATEAV